LAWRKHVLEECIIIIAKNYHLDTKFKKFKQEWDLACVKNDL
jgi:hypothetical protein